MVRRTRECAFLYKRGNWAGLCIKCILFGHFNLSFTFSSVFFTMYATLNLCVSVYLCTEEWFSFPSSFSLPPMPPHTHRDTDTHSEHTQTDRAYWGLVASLNRNRLLKLRVSESYSYSPCIFTPQKTPNYDHQYKWLVEHTVTTPNTLKHDQHV